jgi:membrane protease YdiL (CAAX protease family)
MIGIIIQLALSWLIIWLFQKGNLSFLGLTPVAGRALDFFLFFLLTAACCATGFLLRMYFGKEVWGINPALNSRLIFEGLWWNMKSVLFEELIFRGVLFYIIWKKWGAAKAIIISAIAFGMYHWFSHEVIGDARQMAIEFFLSGVMGLLYAYAYVKTNSIITPVAIHFGWNLTQGFIFSSGATGKGVFVLLNQPVVSVSLFIYLLVVFLPMLSALVVNFLVLRKRKFV